MIITPKPLVWWTLICLLALMMLGLILSTAPDAEADIGNGAGDITNNVDIKADLGGPGGGVTLILCPGVGAGANVLLGGGGYCDFDFVPNRLGGGHVHCEWGGAVFAGGGWACWRVFRGQPDHPKIPDPDIVPDGAPPAPDALRGPAPNDQSPPGGETTPSIPPAG